MSRPQALARQLAAVLSGLLALMGGVVLVAWWAGWEPVTRLHPALASMKANTALLFLGLGASQLLASRPGLRSPSLLLAGAVALLAAGTAAEWLLDTNLGLDQLVAADPFTQGAPPGRPSPATAWLFLLLATGRLLQELPTDRFRLGDVLAGTVGALSLLALSAYATDPSALYALGPFQSMALHTTLGFAAATLAHFAGRPNEGIASLVLSSSESARFIRTTLVVAGLLLPGARILTSLLVEWEIWSSQLSDGLFLTLLAVILSVTLLRGARQLQASESEQERALQELEGALIDLAELNAELLEQGEQLQDSLDERDVLIREVHHRVKNNLAIIASLLRLQAAKMEPGPGREALMTSRQRVMGLADIHQLLYQSDSHAHIPLDSFTRGLAQQIFLTLGGKERGLVLDLDLVPVQIPLSQAVPCSLVLNELLTNTLKHAFPDGRKGRIQVRLRVDGEQVVLSVQDDGVGLPEGGGAGTGLGSSLVGSLTGQLGGELSVEGEEGVSTTVRFPLTPQPDP